MVVINENGEVIFKKINDIGTLSENTINTALLNIRNVLINLLSENYLIYWIIKSLEYKIKLIWQYVIDEKTRLELP